MNREKLEEQLMELPLFAYFYIDPQKLEFEDRIRWICQHECPMYGTTWACPPGVGSVESCKAHIREYGSCLLIATVTEVSDISNLQETLSTRSDHEEITNEVRDLMRAQGEEPFVLSTEACSICEHCAYLDGKPCRHPERMHPCVESQGINIIPMLEECGIEFQYGSNVVTWISLLLFDHKQKNS